MSKQPVPGRGDGWSLHRRAVPRARFRVGGSRLERGATLTSDPSPAESRGGHVHGAEALQRHDERRAAARIRRNAAAPL